VLYAVMTNFIINIENICKLQYKYMYKLHITTIIGTNKID